MIKIFSLLLICTALCACANKKQFGEAKKKADKLLEEIAAGSAIKSFPEKYFPPNQSSTLLKTLKDDCDFANRKGHFINDFWGIENGVKRIYFLYEYYLKCDSVRIVIAFNLGDNIELSRFYIEPIEVDNFMIRNPERQLNY